MRSVWGTKKLGEIIKLEYGKPLEKSKRNPNGRYPVYGANGEKTRSDEYYYNKKSIIIGRKGSAGEVNLTENYFWPLDVTYFVTFDDSICDLFFLYYLFKHLNLGRFAKGVKPGINRNDIYGISSPIPSLTEQKRIVKILNQAFAGLDKAKENTEKNIKNCQELLNSYLNGIFTNPGKAWEEKKLNELGTIQTGTTPKTKYKDNFGNHIPFIKPADIYADGTINYHNEGLSKKGLTSSRLIMKNSILMVCIGASIGKTGYTEKDISCNQQINALTVNESNYPKFFYYAFITSKTQNLVRMNSGQATLPIINKTKWANIKIQLPISKNDQRKIASKLDVLLNKIKMLEICYQKKLNILKEMKKSILINTFNGEL